MNNRLTIEPTITLAVVDNEPWEKLPAESAKAYSAFLSYRNLPPRDRSLKRAATAYYGEAKSSKVRQFQKWSALYMWVDRSTAWDVYVVNKSQEDLLEKVKKLNEKHIQAAQGLFSKAIQRIAKVQAEELTPMDALKYLTESIEIERLALGQPNEIQMQQTGDTLEVTFAEMTDEQLRQHLIALRLAKTKTT